MGCPTLQYCWGSFPSSVCYVSIRGATELPCSTKIFTHFHWGHRLCRCKSLVLRPRKLWIASPPHHRFPDFGMLSGKQCTLHGVGWGGRYLYHVIFLLAGSSFSHARSFENYPQNIWWTSIHTSWNSCHISYRPRGKNCNGWSRSG